MADFVQPGQGNRTPLDQRTSAMQLRGTPADAPKLICLFDEVAITTPDTPFGWALYKWAEEVTLLLSEDST